MVGRAPSSPRDAVAWSDPFRVRTRSTLWIGIAVFIFGLLATGARVLTTQRLYRAEALVIYEPGVLPSEDDTSREVGPHLTEMLTAPRRLERLIWELHLYPALVARHGNMAAAAEKMRDDVRVAPRDGSGFAVSYDAPDRGLAKAVLTRLVNGVVDDDTERRRQQAEAARQALDLERQKAERDLAVKQGRLSDFSAKHPAANNTPIAGGGDRSADTAAEVASLELRAAELEAMLVHPVARAAVPGRELDPAVVAGATHTANPAIVDARAKIVAQLLANERDLDEKQTRLPGQHPEIKAALRRVADARAALRKADAAVAASAAAAAAKPGAGEQTTSLRRALAAVRARITTLHQPSPAASQAGPAANLSDADAAIAAGLARDVSEARERRRQVEGELFQAQLLSTLGAAGRGGGFLVSAEPNWPTNPIAGRRLKVGLVGGSLSLFLGLFAFLLAGRLDGHLHDPTDIARILGPKVVVVVPKLGIKLVGREAAIRRSTAGG
ncbi:MAG TPA: hypothetical protein VFG23_14485 [Polyangia bacterium]|nr:hypothetical protein [Polyangia bacterium]